MATAFNLSVPKETQFNPASCIELFRTLADRYTGEKQPADRFLHLYIQAISQRTWFGGYVSDERATLGDVEQIVKTFFPSADIQEGVFAFPGVYPNVQRTVALKRGKKAIADAPMRRLDEFRRATVPLIALTQAIDGLKEGECLIYQFIIFGRMVFKRGLGTKLLLAGLEGMQRQNDPFRGAFQKNKFEELEEKRKHPYYLCVAGITMNSPERDRLRLVDTVVSTLYPTVHENYPSLDGGYDQVLKIENEDDFIKKDFLAFASSFSQRQNEETALVLTVEEAAAFWHPPHEDFQASRIEWQKPNLAKLPDSLKDVDGILMGRASEDEVRQPLSEVTGHTVIVGKTRVGKSSLAHVIAAEHIGRGGGLMLIDPHYQLTSDILRTVIPPNRHGDVVVLDVSNRIGDVKYPPSINPLAGDPTVLADTMLQVYPDLQGTRMDRWLGMALQTLKADPHAAITDVQRVFEDDVYRARLLDRTKSVALKRSWANYDQTPAGDRASSLNALYNRLDRFASSDHLLSITCNPVSINLGHLIAANKIILVALGGEESGIPASERSILGTSLISQAYSYVMSRGIPEAHRPFLLCVDEAHFFKTAPFPQLLSETGKRGLGVLIADQYFRQLSEETQAALEGNVGTIINFEIGEDDAQAMRPYMSPQFAKFDLTQLGKYKAAVFMRDPQGERPGAFLMHTFRPPQPQNERSGIEVEQAIRRASVENLGLLPYGEVMARIEQSLTHATDLSDNPISLSDDGSDDDEFVQSEASA